ncbi:glutamate receptor ionotropic, delta-1-like [Haliotis asinina]|uniref:glutamate receptor ionotropic, delta-1-like n=1 Tax=Haliotis asinina TaxID=109174 RepID=UPI0035320D87
MKMLNMNHVVRELTSGPLQARLALYHVGSGKDINAILEEAYNTEEDDIKNILIIGSLRMTRGVLLSASRMDDRSTGVISLTSWIVVLPAAHRHVLEDMAPRPDNVVVVSYPAIEETSSWKTLSSLPWNTLEPSRQNNTPSTLNQNTTCRPWNGMIHTLLYKGKRRELSLVGQYDLLGDVHITEELFPNLKLGFNGRLLTVSTKEYAPYVSIQRNGSVVKFDGLCVDLLSNVAKALNFTYQLTETPDGQWGTFVNGSWNGLIRQLQFKEVDIVLAPLTVREDREEVMDFTYPYFYDAAGAIFKRPGLRRWSTLLRPFKWEVLLCLGIVGAGVTLLLHIMEKERRKFWAECQQRNTENRVTEGTIWYIWGTFLKYGSYEQPVTTSGRVLVSFLSLFCIIVSAAYSGNLIAFLSISRESVPFRTSQEMAEQTVYRWGTVNGSLWQLQIANSNQSDFQKLWQGMRSFSESDPDVLAPSSSIHKKKVEAGNYVFFSDRSVMEIWAQENCQLTLLDETFRQITYGMGLPNNSPYRAMFSKVLMKFEKAGLLSLLRQKWWPDAVNCEDNVKVKTHVIEIEDLQSAFYVLLIGFFLAFLILLLENFRILGKNKLSLLKFNMKQNMI